MADERPLLQRLLNTPDLARVVPRLQPDTLRRVIERCGLDDCAELVALATPGQLVRVLDEDLWRTSPRDSTDTLDVERFGQWIAVLLEAGADVAARTIVALDVELVAAALARHVAVFDPIAVSEFTTLDGERMQHRALGGERTAEIGGYVLETKRSSAWDAVTELLEHLAGEHDAYFRGLMRRCMRLSNAGFELDASHAVLGERDQQLHDLVTDREGRRAKRGHVTPAEAQAFLQSARHVRLDDAPPVPDPLWREHHLHSEETVTEAEQLSAQPAPDMGSLEDAEPSLESSVAAVAEVLRDAGIVDTGPRGLLPAGTDAPAPCRLLEAHVDAHPGCAGELAFLANVVLAGCTVQGRPPAPREAADAAAATCNLGLEHWPSHWGEPDLVAAFRVGWTIVHRDVSTRAAHRLVRVLGGIRCSDTDLQLQLLTLERTLVRHLRDDAPWRAQSGLDALLALDAPAWAALVGMLGSCPVMHAAVRLEPPPPLRIDPERYEFIATRNQIDRVHAFLDSLAERLVG